MEVVLALSNFSVSSAPVTVSLDYPVQYFPGKYRVKECERGGYICVYDSAKALLLNLTKDSFTIIGVFFFRKFESSSIFSFATSQGIASFDSGFSPRAALPSDGTDIFISAKHFIQGVEFFDDTLLIGTIDGWLGIVLFRTPEELKGCFLSWSTGYSGLHHWGFDYRSNLCVTLSENKLTLFSYLNDELEGGFDYAIDLKADNASAITLLKQGNRGYVNVIVNYKNSRDFTLITIRLNDTNIYSFENITLDHDLANLLYSSASHPQSFVATSHSLHILAAVLPDFIHFGTICDSRFEAYATVVSGLDGSFEFGHWSKRHSRSFILSTSPSESSLYFAALRSDCVCFLYTLKQNKNKIEGIHFTHRVVLPFPGYCFSPLQEWSGILSIGDCDLVCSPSESHMSVQIQRTFVDIFLPLKGRDSVKEACLVLLLDVIPTSEGYDFVYVLSNGDCFLATSANKGIKRIAIEENPYEVTSILHFAKEKTICVLGFSDGTVKLLTDGRLTGAARATHCGSVDRLITLYDSYVDDSEATFMSVSSQMGTVSVHSFSTAKVSQTLVCPSPPLTSCYWDRSSDYLFLFSGTTAYLWHLPSCTLERTFVISPKHQFEANLADLLTKSHSSPMRVKPFHFLGGRYFSLCINIDNVISDLRLHDNLLPNFLLLTLLLGCCGVATNALPLLSDTRLSDTLQEMSLKVKSVCDDWTIFGTMRLVCALLESTKDAEIALGVSQLSIVLHEKLSNNFRNKSGLALARLMYDYFFTFFVDLQCVSVAARSAFQFVVSNLPPESVLSISENLLSDEMLVYHGLHIVDGPKVPFSQNKARVVSAFLLASGVELESKAKFHGSLIIPVIDAVRYWLDSVKSESLAPRDWFPVWAFSEGFPIFSQSPCAASLIWQLFECAFEGPCEESRRICMQAMSRVMAHDVVKFIEKYCVEICAKHPRWNALLIQLFLLYASNFPCRAFYTCDYLLEFGMHLIGKAPETQQNDTIIGALIQLTRTLVLLLPNVSFHTSSQRVAVGTSDGSVKVYAFKNDRLVTSFKAHSSPILSLAFSHNKASCDLVTLSQHMRHIKVWKIPVQSMSLLYLFSTPSKKFKFFAEIGLPEVTIFGKTVFLMIRFCRIEWLSPQCVRFTSPWHGKVQKTI